MRQYELKSSLQPTPYRLSVHLAVLSILLLISFLPYDTYANELKTNKVIGAKEELIYDILKLAIKKSSPQTSVEQIEEELPLGRLPKALADNTINIMWAGSSQHYDELLLAVRIPLLKGLLGHRLFIIQDGAQKKFDQVHTLEDLKQLRGGLLSRWGTTLVLQTAGLNIIESVSYENLFHMLANDRFDYYPRAIHEPWAELADRPELNLQIEEKLVLVYPYAMYFYVRKEDFFLKQAIENGLKTAMQDGSFDTLFYNNPLIQSAIQQSNFKNRRVIRLPNPYLHKDTPLNVKEYWLDLENL